MDTAASMIRTNPGPLYGAAAAAAGVLALRRPMPPRKIPFVDTVTARRRTTTSWRVKNCNDPLSQLEIRTIHASVESASDALKSLDQELSAAKRRVQSLAAARDSTPAFIAAERALLSPIHTLPPELLAQIFMHHASLFPTHHSCIAAMSVSQVCRGWRRAAHATAVLWSQFPLYYCGPDHWITIPEHQMVLYRAWGTRCGALTFDVELRKGSAAMEKRASHEEFMARERDRMPVLLAASRFSSGADKLALAKPQWRSLHIQYGPTDSFFLGSIPALHSLTIHIVDAEKRKERCKVMDSAPHLEELILRCLPDASSERPVFLPILPLEHLKHCKMDNFPFTNGLQILHEAKALETLLSTNVRTLEINIWILSDGILCPLFHKLTAPELRTLLVKWMYHEDEESDNPPEWDSATLIALLMRSAASLTSLTLLHADICEDELIMLLKHTPLLVHFSLSDRYARRHSGIKQMLGPCLLQRLLPSAPAASILPLVPKLEILQFRGGFDGNDICDTDILHVFEARYTLPSDDPTEYARLKEGALHLMRPADQQEGGQPSLAERARRLVAQGLDFAFTTLQPDPDEPWPEDDPDTDGEESTSSES
ncbi:hypothetical protein C8R47DRAFT_1212408 [Mycena vitilis]|nr:hypothetical protein C8R47DRAFT_1212408 [Mycena vitilis]